MKKKEEKNQENTEESFESVPTSPLDPNWGERIARPTPVVTAPLTSMWRPWEDVVIDLSSAVQASSVAGDKGQTLQSELRTTPIRSIEMTKARLINRLEVHAEGVVEGDWLVEKTVLLATKPKLL